MVLVLFSKVEYYTSHQTCTLFHSCIGNFGFSVLGIPLFLIFLSVMKALCSSLSSEHIVAFFLKKNHLIYLEKRNQKVYFKFWREKIWKYRNIWINMRQKCDTTCARTSLIFIYCFWFTWFLYIESDYAQLPYVIETGNQWPPSCYWTKHFSLLTKLVVSRSYSSPGNGRFSALSKTPGKGIRCVEMHNGDHCLWAQPHKIHKQSV